MQLKRLLVLLAAATSLDAGEVPPYTPEAVGRCLLSTKLGERIRPDTEINPFYLRGDFNGDRRTDYVLVTTVEGSLRKQLLVCVAGARGQFLRNEPADEYALSSQWGVFTAADVKRFGVDLAMAPGAEAIGLLWEDAMRFIFWDGRKFRYSRVITH
jgi:hypothetical protein